MKYAFARLAKDAPGSAAGDAVKAAPVACINGFAAPAAYTASPNAGK